MLAIPAFRANYWRHQIALRPNFWVGTNGLSIVVFRRCSQGMTGQFIHWLSLREALGDSTWFSLVYSSCWPQSYSPRSDRTRCRKTQFAVESEWRGQQHH